MATLPSNEIPATMRGEARGFVIFSAVELYRVEG